MHTAGSVREPYTENKAGQWLLGLLAREDVFTALILNAEEVCEAAPEVIAAIGFDQCNPHHPYDVWVHTAHCVAYAAPVPILRLTLLMHDLGKPETFYRTEDEVGHFNRHEKKGEEIVRCRLAALGFDNETVETVALLTRRHDKGITETELPRWLEELGRERLKLLLDVKEADARAHDEKYKKIQLARVAALRRRLAGL
ncbi:MAG: HD domain-containing protein [Clostridiales bacterium]|nr:HD domain-containing protein [Clostridiales bacterium]